MSDERYVFSATCTWHGPIREARGFTNRPPGCPHCGSVLFEIKDKTESEKGAKTYEGQGHPGFVAFYQWLHDCGRCWRIVKGDSLNSVAEVYRKETGKHVTL